MNKEDMFNFCPNFYTDPSVYGHEPPLVKIIYHYYRNHGIEHDRADKFTHRYIDLIKDEYKIEVKQ